MAGVPDLFLALPRGSYARLLIEMKSVDGITTKEQEKWLLRMKKVGCKIIVFLEL